MTGRPNLTLIVCTGMRRSQVFADNFGAARHGRHGSGGALRVVGRSGAPVQVIKRDGKAALLSETQNAPLLPIRDAAPPPIGNGGVLHSKGLGNFDGAAEGVDDVLHGERTLSQHVTLIKREKYRAGRREREHTVGMPKDRKITAHALIAAARLVAARNALGLSQEEMAADIGITRSRLAQYEVGRVDVSLEICDALFRRHGIDAGWIAHGDPSRLPRALGNKVLECFEARPPVTPEQHETLKKARQKKRQPKADAA